jgi:hypothetical protein
MKVDPKDSHLLLDYYAMAEKFGPLDLDEFVILWHAADAFMEAGLAAGFDPEDVPSLLLTSEP